MATMEGYAGCQRASMNVHVGALAPSRLPHGGRHGSSHARLRPGRRLAGTHMAYRHPYSMNDRPDRHDRASGAGSGSTHHPGCRWHPVAIRQGPSATPGGMRKTDTSVGWMLPATAHRPALRSAIGPPISTPSPAMRTGARRRGEQAGRRFAFSLVARVIFEREAIWFRTCAR